MIILEALSKIDNFSLEELDLIVSEQIETRSSLQSSFSLQGYTFTSKDIEAIHQYFQHHPKLTCHLGPVRQTIEHFTANLLNSIYRHLQDNHLTLISLFQNAEEDTSNVALVEITYDQFLQGLRRAKIPFPVAQIQNIMKYLVSRATKIDDH